MKNPSVNSIVERLLARLDRDRRGNFDPELGLRIGPGMYEELVEAAAEIERLTREVDLLGKLAAPPDTVRFFETTHNIQSASEEFRKRALTAESSLSRIKEETIEALRPFAALLAAIECTTCHAMADGDTWSAPDDAGIVKISDLRKAAEVYRSLGSTGGAEKTAESDHSPSTSTTATE